MIEFVKAHGTGNDFVVIGDLLNRVALTDDLVIALCDRHFGIGADGVIRIGTDTTGAFFMDYRNADASFAEMCGNGVRVVGKWLGDRGYCDNEVDLLTRAGKKHLKLQRDTSGQVARVTVDMGPPVGEVTQLGLSFRHHSYNATVVSMGNPHAVLFVDDVDAIDLLDFGPAIERHEHFPHGTNVEFVEQTARGLKQRTWERGVGETLACGTGACAVVVAAQGAGPTSGMVNVELTGGTLLVEIAESGTVLMTGDAVEVAEGHVDPVALLRRRGI